MVDFPSSEGGGPKGRPGLTYRPIDDFREIKNM